MSRVSETYAYLRANHRCVQCRKVDAYTLNGRAYCAECTAYRNAYYARRWKARPDVRADNQRRVTEFLQKRRDQGLCPSCGRKSEPPYIYCAACRAKRRRLWQEYYDRKKQREEKNR